MLDLSRDIHPLTAFKRNTSEFLSQLKATGRPVVFTINGKAEIVVQDAKSYQVLLAIAERLETIEAVKEGLASIGRDEGRPMQSSLTWSGKSAARPGDDVPSRPSTPRRA